MLGPVLCSSRAPLAGPPAKWFPDFLPGLRGLPGLLGLPGLPGLRAWTARVAWGYIVARRLGEGVVSDWVGVGDVDYDQKGDAPHGRAVARRFFSETDLLWHA